MKDVVDSMKLPDFDAFWGSWLESTSRAASTQAKHGDDLHKIHLALQGKRLHWFGACRRFFARNKLTRG